MSEVNANIDCINSGDLVTRVKLSLGKLSYHQLDDVSCSIERGNQVTLSGKLRSYYLKQIAQTIAQKVPGVVSVQNDILVMD
ncbi:BON domain protein [Thalassoglobus neptunius]|uniref:BON domain protein n=1 Tax=Thalassoglobus neptunius TaxID=1938619 RepID=A0A5C5X4W7_9PLAN|nr:BON domain protein [Thalassoglobus neptunius]